VTWSQRFLRWIGFAITREGLWYNDRRGSTHLIPWRRTPRFRCQDCGGRFLRCEVHLDESGVWCYQCLDRNGEAAAEAAKGDR
jgi:hypothetical protein